MDHSPGPFRAEGGAVKAISHGIWYTVALVDKKIFTPEGRKENATFLAHAATHYDELLEALKDLMRHQQILRGGTIGERHPLQTARENAIRIIAKAEPQP